ncbi:MAG: HYR domain-containing protein, partial [Saprospiraceae bacterium]|nr:HYR domain-containing protein [Saprospiraceae bacterium]
TFCFELDAGGANLALPAGLGDMFPLDGSGVTGGWNLEVLDQFNADQGTLNEWGLIIEYEQQLAFAPTVTENCGFYTLDYVDTEIGDDCTGGGILRTWTATDASGNTGTCVQTINITPLSLSGLECPANYTGECGGSTSPSVTGYPMVNGIPVGAGGICNIFAGYTDLELTDCGAGLKIVRTWTLLDWCTQETAQCVQVIKLTDNQGPVLDCPDDITVNADPWFCTADVNLTPPAAYDACGTSFSLSVSSSAGVIVPFGSYYRVDDLPLGTHTITWTAVDACDNESSCSYDITVEDNTPPVPLCDEHTIVALTSDDPLQEGLTKIPATVFDDGSYDNCSAVTFTARRMTSCINFDWIGPAPLYGEYPNSDGIVTSLDRGQTHQLLVPFACCDVGAGPIMVELRVTDAEGNVNTCMVEVEVQDKLSPFLEQPPDIIVSCDFWFDVAETNGFVDPSEDVTTPIFGDVLDAYEFEPSDRQPIILNDPGNDEYPQPYQWGYDGWADDNCDVEITVRVRLFDDCSGDNLPGAPPSPYTTRLVERTWRARDASNNSTTRVQRIWVVDFDPFYISDQTCVNADPNDGVIWPCDETYTTCPDEIPVNYPTVFDDNCSLIGVTYDDTRFDFVDGACYKILREWTIIDWCQYDVNTGAGLWSHIQVIKVLDSDPADFTDCPSGPVTLCVENDNVYLPNNNQVFLGEGNPNSSSCSAHVNMSRTVYETCSDYVIYDVKLYPNAGSEYIQVVSKTEVDLDSNNNATLTFSSEFATLPSNHPIRRYGIPYNSPVCSNWPLPGGTKDYHRILWTVEDGCGNISTCEYLFRLEDCKKPSPVCVGLSSVVMPSSGEVTIWAVDFNASSFDDCTPAEDLLRSDRHLAPPAMPFRSLRP